MHPCFMSESGSGPASSFERIRKLASMTALTVFATSFVVLLVLSATRYWVPENEWIVLADQVWKISGLTALVLGAIPPIRRFANALGQWLGFDGAR